MIEVKTNTEITFQDNEIENLLVCLRTAEELVDTDNAKGLHLIDRDATVRHFVTRVRELLEQNRYKL